MPSWLPPTPTDYSLLERSRRRARLRLLLAVELSWERRATGTAFFAFLSSSLATQPKRRMKYKRGDGSGGGGEEGEEKTPTNDLSAYTSGVIGLSSIGYSIASSLSLSVCLSGQTRVSHLRSSSTRATASDRHPSLHCRQSRGLTWQ